MEVGLGRDISGEPMTIQLNEMPHLLVAGSTGSGKSVCINGIITSILLNAKPHEVKLMLIDPKMVELNVYNGVPHLLIPVVTNPHKASQALEKVVLKWNDDMIYSSIHLHVILKGIINLYAVRMKNLMKNKQNYLI